MNNLLLSPQFIFFTTRDYALANHQSLPAASRSLQRLAKKKVIQKVTKGIWANDKHPYFSPLGCVPLLLGSEEGYVSFLTALQYHGVISQIPSTIQIATTGHGRKLKTPIGIFEFFKLKPTMMTDKIEWTNAKTPYRMATPEKALMDTLYISTRKGKRFVSLPEIEGCDKGTLLNIVKQQIPNDKIRTAILTRLVKMTATNQA